MRFSSKLPYQEGTWFAVTLRGGGYAPGIIARSPRTGRCLLGYFFGPRSTEPPLLKDLCQLTPEQSVCVLMFGDLRLMEGKWPILGKCEDWKREDWPMPIFVQEELLSGRKFLVHYDDSNTNKVLYRERVEGDTSKYPADLLSGAGAVEVKLDVYLKAS